VWRLPVLGGCCTEASASSAHSTSTDSTSPLPLVQTAPEPIQCCCRCHLSLTPRAVPPALTARGGAQQSAYCWIVRFLDRLMVSRLSTFSSVWELSRICGRRAGERGTTKRGASRDGTFAARSGERERGQHHGSVAPGSPNSPSCTLPRSPGSSGRTRYGLHEGIRRRGGVWWAGAGLPGQKMSRAARTHPASSSQGPH
jgi:hypothetical protein